MLSSMTRSAVSSTEGFNVEAFVDVVAAYLPQGPRWFPEGMGTDEADEVMVAEFVREKVLRHTREEIPHAVGVMCDEFERPKRDLLRLHATVYVEREGQKGIIVGKGGEMIKRIGVEARRDLERMFGCRVFLGLDVKVKPHWREDAREIRRFGYAADDGVAPIPWRLDLYIACSDSPLLARRPHRGLRLVRNSHSTYRP